MGQTHPSFTEAASPTTTFPYLVTLLADTNLTIVLSAMTMKLHELPGAPRSLGIEYVESKGLYVVTVGYDPQAPKAEVIFLDYKIGNLFEALEPGDGASDKLDVASLEYRMAEVLREVQESGTYLCHEIFVTTNGDLSMVVMLQPSSITFYKTGQPEPTAE